MNTFKELSKTELEIMDVMWGSLEPKTHVELLDYFNTVKQRDWKPQTLTTYTAKLLEKGLLQAEQKGRTKHYTPAVTKKEYERAKAKGLLDTLYEGSLSNFMVALYGGKSVPEVEMEKLKQWLMDK